MAIGAVSEAKTSRTTISGAAISGTIKTVSGSSQSSGTNKSDDTKDSKAEIGQDKDGTNTETQVTKTDAEKKVSSKRISEILALKDSIPGGREIPKGKDLVDVMKQDPGQFKGIDDQPKSSGSSSASPDLSAQANAAGSFGAGGGFGGGGAGGFGGSNGQWSGAGAQPYPHNGGVNPGNGGGGIGSGHLPSLAALNARADSIAAAEGARMERIYDPRGGLQQVVIHDANEKVQRELAQLAPLYKEVTGRSPTGREVQTHGDHSDIVLKFGNQADQLTASVDNSKQQQEAENQRQQQEAQKQSFAERDQGPQTA